MPVSTEAFLSVRGIRKSFGSVTALLGENGAGKSTFVRILAGDHAPDEGRITIDGSEVQFHSVGKAREAGIRLIAQEIADAPTLSVAENINLGALPARWGFVNRESARKTARGALDALGAEIPLDAKVETLRLGERQIIEIARATIGESRCIIFDEPTAALSDAETRRLFDLIERMRAQGAAILYITHRLDEVFEIADRVCVLRDGRVSLDARVGDVDQAAVVTAMVGRELGAAEDAYTFDTAAPAEPLLQVRDLSGDSFDDVELDVAPGEIVGLYGKVGSGVPEFAATLFGASPRRSGTVCLQGAPVHFKHPAEAVARGVGFLPADRASEGLLRTRTAAENLAAPSWKRLARNGFIARRHEAAAFGTWHRRLHVRARPDGAERITTLSGGNQQKVLLGRWLENRSRLLLLVEPTRGVDVGAREEIYQLLRNLAREGHGILIASSDYEDITYAATRALVMVRGRIVAKLKREDISMASLTRVAGGAAHA